MVFGPIPRGLLAERQNGLMFRLVVAVQLVSFATRTLQWRKFVPRFLSVPPR